ncbi:EscI/YscI/HrpB family type III secretion system inner rod protein [Paraherbaspirillum soli]|uniref:EscI/YscI/HrpB family type III secretion system inner rod protein n=1 Tax=Paraherbaspirillum soli TaxID=631222 RepID=A0ABW0MAR2_9BURK
MQLPVTSPVTSVKPAGQNGQLQIERPSFDRADAEQFRTALEQHGAAAPGPTAAPKVQHGNRVSLGDKIMTHATDLAGDVKQNQVHVSKMLEQATRTGDSASLMKAMLALNDYQMRVQFVSKTVSKATSSLDSLTKLQ